MTAGMDTTSRLMPEDGEIVLRGVAAVPGLALGPITMYHRPEISRQPGMIVQGQAAIEAEQEIVRNAMLEAEAALKQLAEEVQRTIGAEQAAIFEAQSLIASDPTLSERAIELVATMKLPAYEAILAATGEQADLLAALDDAYLRERATDIIDVGKRAAHLAVGEKLLPNLGNPATPGILLAEDLTPSETVKLDKQWVLGIGLSGGGPTSHVAVVARALGVPLVCGLGPLAFPTLDTSPDLQEQALTPPDVLLDGDAGQLVLFPGPQRLAAYHAWSEEHQSTRARQDALHDMPAETSDGHRIKLAANVGATKDAQAAQQYGAEGIGLLRTEFLFLDHLPGEDEQLAAYKAIVDSMPEGDLVVRTMDLGGDKPPPYLDFGQEENPFLGWRGIRVALDEPDMLHTQLRALFMATPGRTIQVMFPMISTLNELQQARAAVNAVRAELAEQGVPMSAHVEVGIMIEVPAAALMSDALAPHVDFFSIGTNDLTQYTMATDRGATKVAHLYSAVQPSVLRLIDLTVRAAHKKGKWVGICGEAAGNPAWSALWLGLGLDELSMSPASIPAVKEAIRRTTFKEAQELASIALQMPTLEDVQNHIHQRSKGGDNAP